LQLLNLILRNLLHYNLMDQASNVVAKTRFPEGASNNQLCRYLYYVGRIQAIQLDYTEAFTKLNQVTDQKVPIR
jgi:26S proteasome regulatory subunit N3